MGKGRLPLALESTSRCGGSKLPVQKEMVSSGDSAGEGLLPTWETAKTVFESLAYKLHKCKCCKFLAKVTQEPKSTGSVSSALSKYLTMFPLFLLLTAALVSNWHCLVNRVVGATRRVPMFPLLTYSGAASPRLQTRQGLEQQYQGWMVELHAWPEMASACLISGAKEPQSG